MVPEAPSELPAARKIPGRFVVMLTGASAQIRRNLGRAQISSHPVGSKPQRARGGFPGVLCRTSDQQRKASGVSRNPPRAPVSTQIDCAQLPTSSERWVANSPEPSPSLVKILSGLREASASSRKHL